MRLLWGLIWASSFFTLSLQKPRLLLFSPSVVHLGVPLSVGVQLQDVPRGQLGKDFALLSLQVPLKDAKSCGLHQLLRGPEVQLVAQSPWLKDSLSRTTNIQGVNLLFSSRRGHLFLQTDQPIYNPGQRVRYRVFALDQKMRPSTDTITVTVENSHGLRVRKKEVYIPSSIFQDDFVIPDISEPGPGRSQARFSDGLESNSSTQFEVKKYVLPNFEVKITPGKPYILTVPGHLDEMQLDIQARYIYGKPVQGWHMCALGSWMRMVRRLSFGGWRLVNGQSHIVLSKAEFQDALEKLNMSITDSRGCASTLLQPSLSLQVGDFPLLWGMEEAELTSWYFVSSPFSLDLSKTKRHLVPGAPFLLQALVREDVSSPASGIPVKVSARVSSPGSVPEVQDIQQSTDGSGQVSIPIIIPQTISELQLSVGLLGPLGDGGEGEEGICRLSPSSHSQAHCGSPTFRGPGFLSIERPDSRPPRVGDTLNLNLRAVGQWGHLFSLLLHDPIPRADRVHESRAQEDPDLGLGVCGPSTWHPPSTLWPSTTMETTQWPTPWRVDVQAGACEGKLELSKTDSLALVALGALDTALYAAGSKSHKPLNMGKVFEVMNSYDLGVVLGVGQCPSGVPGSGPGLSDGDQWTYPKDCPKEKTTRKKRNVNFQKAINEKLGQYASPTAKRCCQDGVTRLPMMRSCEQRAARVQQPDCREPFLSCCQFAESLRKKNRDRGQAGLQRALEILQEEDLIDEDDIPVRSFFPENWLWRVETVDRFQIRGMTGLLCLSYTDLTLWLPDSLTTWEIHGLSLSKTKGLCVATPVQLRVFREFHLHLRLPVSVRRFEQLELRPVLYNYLDKNLTVSVHVSPVEGLCLAGGGGLAQQIEKEGAIHTEELVYELNPLDHRGRTLEIPGNSDPNMIPDGDFNSYVRVTASDPLDTLGSEGALSPGGVASLLRLPRGCGEQTMIYLAPTLAASRYLDKTEQWSTLPPETKDYAVDLIQKGYLRIQQFRKADGSYAAWFHGAAAPVELGRGSQSFVLKETCNWLLSQQQADGSFQDLSPVIHRSMQDEVAEPLKQRVEASISKGKLIFGRKQVLGTWVPRSRHHSLCPTLTKAPADLRGVAHNNLIGNGPGDWSLRPLHTAATGQSRDGRHGGRSPQALQGDPPNPRHGMPWMPCLPMDWPPTPLRRGFNDSQLHRPNGAAVFPWAPQDQCEGGVKQQRNALIAWGDALRYGTREVCGLTCPVSSPCPLLSQVLRIYNVLDMKNTTCQDLQIEVTVKGHVEYTREANEDYEDYEYDELPAKDDPDAPLQPVTPLQLFEGRRNRRRREAPKLTSLSDRYVSHFETEGPHVLLYFDSVPTSRECVGFEAVQEVPVGLVQPASATLYDYYNPERRCSVFYGAPSKSRLLATLCSAEVCQCAEGKCPRQRRALERGLQDEDGYRMKFACYYPRVEYGFQVKVLREDSRAAFRLFETKITQVLHFTKDVKATANQMRNFLVRASCRLRLEPGKEYLIMGLDGATYDLEGHPQYLLDSNSWIEEMPSERLCRSTRQRAALPSSTTSSRSMALRGARCEGCPPTSPGRNLSLGTMKLEAPLGPLS
ncbi:C4A isoform 2 [Pongo abelii]|uniref:C4A isoform 2 n=1 Tax=Pongo abelii TaxID=9601 RepID=A0A2J8QYY2_PONAB|nr:C4A isoform 2 [Pongo abelii]